MLMQMMKIIQYYIQLCLANPSLSDIHNDHNHDLGFVLHVSNIREAASTGGRELQNYQTDFKPTRLLIYSMYDVCFASFYFFGGTVNLLPAQIILSLP